MVEKSTHKVIIRRCENYDPSRIAGIIKEGMEELGIRPYGRVLLKPNVVIAHKKYFPNAFTRKEFLDGVLSACKELGSDINDLSVGERSGIIIPTRFNFKQAGYLEIIKRHNVKTHYFDEERHIPIPLKHAKALRNHVYIPKPIVDTDFLINLPKFKAHPWCRLTLSLKNFIGLQDDRHRLVDHNQYLEHKIADLQEVIQPKFIAIDAIIAGEKMMLTPTAFHMGAIIMGTNSCAVDTVGCHMVNVEPKDVIHLKYASNRGYGPMDISQIEISGDFPLDELKNKNKDFHFLLERIDKYFNNGSNLKCQVGAFPEKHSKDYCWGGCPGALQEAVHIYKSAQPDILKSMKKVRYIAGKIEGDISLDNDERILFAGDCASFNGRINGKKVNIPSLYQGLKKGDEHHTKSNDMIRKTIQTLSKTFMQKNKPYIRAKGCPVSVGDHVHYISSLGKVKNMNFHPDLVFGVNLAYLKMRFNRFKNTIFR